MSYGFLATRAEKAAKLLEENETLSGSDIEALNEAAQFLKKISTGAEYLTTKNFQAQDLLGALDALSLAMDPIKTLATLFGDREISQIFSETAETVSKHLQGRKVPLTENERRQIQIFRQFFDALYAYVSSMLEQEAPVLGPGVRGEGIEAFSR
ncbi:MAG TPA: hypothetical protein VNM24_06980 [Burkholderiales bacterium]|nr:hypothetical protein [Burkholderiales bacterium]